MTRYDDGTEFEGLWILTQNMKIIWFRLFF